MSAAASRVLLSRAPARRTTLRSAVAAASGARTLATAPPPAPKPTTRLPARKRGKDDVLRPEEHERTWLARYIDGRPAARDAFLRVARAFGHGSPKQRAVRRTLGLYEVLCAGRAEEEAAFWRDQCDLPPTFQSWFSVANLHTWLLTARLRALPAPAGQQHIQALVDHFFYDVEDRIRRVLRAAPTQGAAFPLPMPTSSPSSPTRTPTARAAALQPYYVPPARPARGYAPERLVAQQMRVLREQWAGLALALDVALARGDAELAAAAWRNLMGARGAQGIAFPWAGMTPEQDAAHFHRAINFAGMKAREAKKVDDAPERVAAQERQDDFSGVHDYRPSEADKYVAYPETMHTLVSYIRRELARLERIPDADLIGPEQDARGHPFPPVLFEDIERLRFGPIRP